MLPSRETRRVLIVVRTYPTPARSGIEVSCTAGITATGEWIRLFPVPYRFLAHERRFAKYQWIDVEVAKASDPRPESYTINPDSIRLVGSPLSTAARWRDRKAVVSPLAAHCLCCLIRERDSKKHPTLGLFRPKTIGGLFIRPDSSTWSSSQLAALRQVDMFRDAPSEELEKIPFKFGYKFACDEPSCSGHELSCLDWEMSQSWRSWRTRYGTDWEGAFRQKYEAEMIGRCDLQFYVGTIRAHPHKWTIVGLFYPPKTKPSDQGDLFAST